MTREPQDNVVVVSPEMPEPTDAAILWGVPSPGESRWPATIAVVGAIVLHTVLPERLVLIPKWIYPVILAALLVPLLIYSPRRGRADTWARVIGIVIIALLSLANAAALVLLSHTILTGRRISGHPLIIGAIEIWLMNVVVFGLWYWELDRGGPEERIHPHHRQPDFLFPQMASPGVANRDWSPTFVDYLYVSLTNAAAFSPTDTMPLTRWSKVLMGIQSVVSLVTVALVAARAVNILS